MVASSDEGASQLSALLNAIGESTPDLLWAKDRAGVLIYCNSAAGQRVGHDADEMLGRLGRDFEIYAEDGREAAEAHVLATGEPRTIIGRWTDPKGETLPYQIALVPLRNAAGAIIGILRRTRNTSPASSASSLIEAIGEATPDSVFAKDTAHRFTYGNTAFLRRMNVSRESLIGRTNDEVWPGVPDKFAEGEERVLRTGEVTDMEWTGTVPDGSTRTVLARRFPIRQANGDIVGMAGFVSDISAAAELRRELAAFTQRLTQINDLTPNILWTLSMEGEVSTVNSRWEEFTGRSPVDDSSSWSKSVHAEDRPGVLAEVRRMIDHGEPWKSQFRLLHQSGKYRWVLAKAHRIENENGELGGWVGSFTDCDDLVRAERKAQQLHVELAHVQRVNDMGQMASAIAHELNQPLAASANYMQGCIQTMAGPSPDLALTRDGLERARDQILRAGEVIRRLRDFLTKREPTRVVEDLSPIIADAVAMCQAGQGHRRLVVRVDLAPDARRVKIDRIEIQQVVVNLLRNAFDAMQAVDSGSEVTISTRRVERGMVEVTVRDTGPGLEPEVLAQLFTPFLSTKTDGMGIGLSISRTIVEAQGGRIWVTAPEGRGASFHFTIPDAPERIDG